MEEAFPVGKPKTIREQIERDISKSRDAKSKLQALIANQAPQSQINEMREILSQRQSKTGIHLRRKVLPESVVPDIIEEALPYYEDISFKEALRSEALRTGEKIAEEVPKKSVFNKFNLKRMGKIAKIAATQSAINVLWPGNFWYNIASTGAWEAGSYAGKRLGLSKIKQYALGGAGIIAVQIGSRISAKDDDYNTIEGLRHGGVAEFIRKQLTEFGSGWDSARALAKSIYKEASEKEAFELLRKSPEWKQMLKSADEIAPLAHGAMGTTYLMQGRFKDQSVQFIKKIGKVPEGVVGYKGGKEVTDAMRLESIKREGSSLLKMEDRISPSFYGYEESSNTLYMELMKGDTLNNLVQKENALVPLEDIIRKTKRELAIAADRGVLNRDLTMNNIMYDPINKRVSWIDFGEATMFNPIKELADEKFEQMSTDLEGLSKGLGFMSSKTEAMTHFTTTKEKVKTSFGLAATQSIKSDLKAENARLVAQELESGTITKGTAVGKRKRNLQQQASQQIQNSFITSKNGARGHRRFNSVATKR